MKHIKEFLTFAAIILLLTVVSNAADDDLLRRVPPNTNAIVVIDVAGVLNSPLAIREGWKNKHEAAYVARPIMLPPEADKIILATQLNPARDFEQSWELAVMHLKEPLSMRSIARAEGGYVDTINGLQAAWTPSDAYFVSLDPTTMGVMYPANRQAVSRWADFGKNNQETVLSPYLKQAAGKLSRSSQIVMAMDLKDVPQQHRVRERLNDNELLKGSKSKINEIVRLVSTIQGVTLQVEIGNAAKGKLSIDFTQSPDVLGKLAKPLVLAVLDRSGAYFEDVEKWTAESQGYSLVLEGPLSTDGMRRLFSLLEIPTTKFSTLKDQETNPGSTDSVARASLTYFKSINVLVKDLRKSIRGRRNDAAFTDRYARKIDRLPILHVDEDLLNYGAKIAETFREMSVSRKSSLIRAGVRKSGVYGNYYRTGNNGYYGVTRSSSVRNEINAQQNARATTVKFQSFQDIDNSTAEIRRAMTKRYELEF